MNSLYVLRTASLPSAPGFAGPGLATAALAGAFLAGAFLAGAVLAGAVLAGAAFLGALVSGTEISLQTVPAAFAAEAGLTIAAERAARVEPVVGVRPHHPG